MTEIDPFDAFAEKMAKVELDRANEVSGLFSSEGEIKVERGMDVDELAELYERVAAQAKAFAKAKSHLKQYLTDVVLMSTTQTGPGVYELKGGKFHVSVTKSEQYSFDEKLALNDMDQGTTLPECVGRKLDMTPAKIAKLDQQTFDKLRKYMKKKEDKTEVEVTEI